MGSVADEDLRPRFIGRSVKGIYRNDGRFREFGNGRIGSMAGFSRAAGEDVSDSLECKGMADLAGTRIGSARPNCFRGDGHSFATRSQVVTDDSIYGCSSSPAPQGGAHAARLSDTTIADPGRAGDALS